MISLNKEEYFYTFGLVPFETIYFENGELHLLYEHYNRMRRGFKTLKLPFSLPFEKFEEYLRDYITKTNLSFGALRIHFKGKEPIIEEKEIKYDREKYNRGLAIKISKIRKYSHNILNYIKTFNMGLNVIEEERAKSLGFDTCLFLNEKKLITETAFGNIFFRKEKTLYTPHIQNGILPGIMRKKVIEVAKSLGYQVDISFLKLEDIKNMEECFITTSVAGAFPVKNIEKISFSSKEFSLKLAQIEIFKRPWNT
nr:aminotransferase class IV [Dictyoglomus turgidum]